MSQDKPDPDSTLVDCEQAPALISAFAASQLPPEGLRRLRVHLAKCPTCQEAYREVVQATASLGRRGSENREQRNVDRAKENLRSKYFGGSRASKITSRKHGLRLALIPALAIFLMIKVTGLGEEPARVDLILTDGIVKLDSRQVSISDEPLLVLPGRWLQTGKFSKALLEANSATVEIDARTDCLLEAARPLRFRLRRGSVSVDGDVLLYTVIGIVSVVGGKGQLHIGSSGLTIEAQSGEWTLLDSSGESAIDLGRPVTILPEFMAAN
ncbi:MAG: hypothetical protein ACI89E_002395 [Planctomycetota bacterium]|jgi:hypothetical protein